MFFGKKMLAFQKNMYICTHYGETPKTIPAVEGC